MDRSLFQSHGSNWRSFQRHLWTEGLLCTEDPFKVFFGPMAFFKAIDRTGDLYKVFHGVKGFSKLWIGVENFSRSSMDRRYFRGFCAPDTFPRASIDRRVFQGLLWTENLFNDFYGPNNFSRYLDRKLF